MKPDLVPKLFTEAIAPWQGLPGSIRAMPSYSFVSQRSNALEAKSGRLRDWVAVSLAKRLTICSSEKLVFCMALSSLLGTTFSSFN